jgi:hypothetical protein
MRYLIAGYGHFGRIALERIRAHFPRAAIVVVESDPAAIEGSGLAGLEVVPADAVNYLAQNPNLDDRDMIVPMVPIHLAAAYILACFEDARTVPSSDAVSPLVPNPCPIDRFTTCSSRADFVCPDDCPEGDLCAVTGLPREEPLYSRLGHLAVPGFKTLVQRSFQILPGIGGYAFGELQELASKIERGRYLVATACKCHGIITSLERRLPAR